MVRAVCLSWCGSKPHGVGHLRGVTQVFCETIGKRPMGLGVGPAKWDYERSRGRFVTEEPKFGGLRVSDRGLGWEAMAALGQRNLLAVVREAPPGLYLDGGNLGEILLPNRYITQGVGPGDQLDVFVYLDSEDRLVATTEQP